MTVKLTTLVATAIIVAASSARAADGCSGSAFLPEQNPIYELTLLAQKSNTPHATTADLSISARPPGVVYTARGTALALKNNMGGSDLDVYLKVLSAGLIPTKVKVMVYYPVEIAALPHVTLSGPFGVVERQASRPDPKLNDVYANFALTDAQLNVLSPGAQLDLTVNANDGTLLESGTFDVADVATLKMLAKAAASDLNLFCIPQENAFPF
jgi:hypothetical protein